MISLPADLLAEQVDASTPTAPPVGTHPCPAPSRAELSRLREMLRLARRPVLIAGGGIQHAREDLLRFAETYRIGVYSAFRRQDVFPNDHELYLGHLTVAAPVETLTELRAADLVLVLGSTLDQMTTQQFEVPTASATTVQVDIEPSVLGAVVDLDRGILADPGELVRALLEQPFETPERSWAEGHATYLQTATVGRSRSSDAIDPAVAIRSMSEAFPDDTIVTSDAGNFATFLHRYWSFRHARSQAAPTNGAMGYAVPGAVGAKAAMPDRSVLGVVGDGGFLMTGQEIETAVRYGLDLTIVVMRNGLYGTIAMHQAKEMGRTAAVDIGDYDAAGFARSLGANGITVRNEADLDGAMREAASTSGVHVVDVTVDPDLITPTGRLSEMFAAQ